MSILIIQILNSLFYASVLFLIAAGLSLIFGVMRIVNMAHGTSLCRRRLRHRVAGGRAVAPACRPDWPFLLIPGRSRPRLRCSASSIEPLLLRPFYRRAEEYQLLVTFGLLLILEDVMRFFWGGLPLSGRPDHGRCCRSSTSAV